MKAFSLEAPGRSSYREVPPPSLGPADVLLRVERLGLCGTDLSSWRGTNALVSYPRIPGHELAAVVARCGENVSNEFREGQTVTVLPYTACGACSACRRGRTHACEHNQTLGVQRDGAFVEFIAVPQDKVIPTALNSRDRALIEPLSIGFHAVDRAELAGAETVLVLGSGMIGLGVIAGATARGARVIAADIDDSKLALAVKAGASKGLRSDAPDFSEQLKSLAADGPDVVIEAAGTAATYQRALETVSFAGRVVCIGYTPGPVTLDPRLIVRKELQIRGSRNATRADFERVITLLESGRYPAAETVTQVGTWAEAGTLLKSWSDRPETVTKIQIVAP